MDAQAYLLRHGWSGPGNPLNPNRRPGTHGGLGLTRPILVARRSGNQGVGKKTTKDPTNQWWLRGFEDALKDVGKEKSADAVAKPNALTSELYRFFVRGEVIAGTLGDKDEEKTAESGTGSGSASKKRKVDEEDEESSRVKKVKKEGETKEERRLRREEKKKRKEEEAKQKIERRKAREEKRLRKEGEQARKMERRKAREEKRLRREMKKRAPEEDYPTPPLTEQEQTDSAGRDESSAPETKELRKAKKEKKDKKDSKETDESKKRKREESSTEDGSKSKSKKPKDKKKSQA